MVVIASAAVGAADSWPFCGCCDDDESDVASRSVAEKLEPREQRRTCSVSIQVKLTFTVLLVPHQPIIYLVPTGHTVKCARGGAAGECMKFENR